MDLFRRLSCASASTTAVSTVDSPTSSTRGAQPIVNHLPIVCRA
jgi:hypothetical protein